MDLSCEVCNGQFFYSRDGVTYCARCNSESRAHGHETVVDEETIGTFQSGMAAALKVLSLCQILEPNFNYDIKMSLNWSTRLPQISVDLMLSLAIFRAPFEN